MFCVFNCNLICILKIIPQLVIVVQIKSSHCIWFQEDVLRKHLTTNIKVSQIVVLKHFVYILLNFILLV